MNKFVCNNTLTHSRCKACPFFTNNGCDFETASKNIRVLCSTCKQHYEFSGMFVSALLNNFDRQTCEICSKVGFECVVAKVRGK